MNSDNQQFIYSEEGEYRVYCNICDELCKNDFIKII